jgi:hypothetical protein
MSDYVQKPDVRLLVILSGLSAHYGKSYCFPSYDKILQLMRRRFAGRPMSRRTLARHLGALTAQWYIGRVRRHKRGEPRRGERRGRLILRSTLYHIFPRARAMVANFVRPFVRSIMGGLAVPILAVNNKSLLRLSFPPSTA